MTGEDEWPAGFENLNDLVSEISAELESTSKQFPAMECDRREAMTLAGWFFEAMGKPLRQDEEVLWMTGVHDASKFVQAFVKHRITERNRCIDVAMKAIANGMGPNTREGVSKEIARGIAIGKCDNE